MMRIPADHPEMTRYRETIEEIAQAARQPDLRKARAFVEDRSEWDERPRW
jgi:hypothetical protein